MFMGKIVYDSDKSHEKNNSQEEFYKLNCDIIVNRLN